MGAIHMLAAADLTGGGYVNIFKVVPAILLLLIWAKLLAWADKDAVVAHLPRIPLNIGMLSGLVAAYFMFFVLPYYFVTFPLLVVVFGADIGTYLAIRHKKVGLDDLKVQFNEWLHSFGKKKEIKAVAGQVLLITKNGQAIEPPAGDAPDRPAYDATQLALTDALQKGAEQIDVDSRSDATLKYTVDCVSYPGSGLDRASAATAIGYIKAIAGMDIEDRRKPQTGNMRMTMDGKKHDVRVQTAGSTAGEMMRLELDPKKKHDYQLGDLGFTERQLALVKESIADNIGIVLLSAPKGMGLTSLMYGILRGHDAFLQHIQTVERDAQQDLDGVTQNKLAANAPAAEEFKTTDWVISQEPNVILINKIEDPRSATELIKFSKAEGGRRVYVGIRANSTFEALEQWRKLVGDDSVALETLKLVINGRVMRKLCMACKVEFAPEPGMVRKLGMNPEKVTKLFQARTQPLRDQKGNPIVCEFCQDLRYKGRQGVFEIMVIDDEMRQAIIAGKPVEPVFRRQRARFLQDEALALVEAGETSVQEVKRVMKGGSAEAESPPPAERGGGGGKSPPPRPKPPAPRPPTAKAATPKR
jgi:type II secretory ATPase GspE/PulE/Tfp pilus assembly ATPase PilB-like protein